ncbi:MAG: hemerythrin [Rhodocyclales bacterium RIFCSPLOWO2_02_FULL_63_24]|nr:MAG: hemerythrin [Rhodocyclales bacterium GWA2_65_19]OHC69916.1 MAG: hemerythrin [Rhodocyclales bacterium RIFCSPLOWO2_02_FULL_63_24]
MTTPQSFKTTVDVRSIAPRERHPLIFGSFDRLAAGEALLLVNDHDPKPLYYQFQAESKGQFTWDYLESGPEVWQVKIGKPAIGAATSGACGCAH